MTHFSTVPSLRVDEALVDGQVAVIKIRNLKKRCFFAASWQVEDRQIEKTYIIMVFFNKGKGLLSLWQGFIGCAE